MFQQETQPATVSLTSTDTTKVDGQPSPSRIAKMKQDFIRYQENPTQFLDMTTLTPYGDGSFIVDGLSLEKLLGVEFLGAGVFGKVYGMDDRKVLKVLNDKDAGFDAFIDFCQQHRGNPHLPRVYYRGRWGSRSVYIMERLDMGEYEERDFIAGHIRSICTERASPNKLTRWLKPDCFGPQLNFICEQLRAFKSQKAGLGWDLHAANVMLRGETPVITDPFVGG